MTVDAPLREVEDAFVATVGASMMGTPHQPAAPAEITLGPDVFEFDSEFQTKIVVHALRNLDFMRKTAHLLKPDYFENAGEAAMVNIAIRYFQRYSTVPTAIIAGTMLKEDIANKVIRSDIKSVTIEACREAYKPGADLSDGSAIAERVAEFAQHQAMAATILESVDLLGKGQFDKIREKVKAAYEVGLNLNGDEYDYFKRLEERTNERNDRKMGILPPQGITTGHKIIDDLLYHRGWGRKELSIILGGAKSGKTTALINFAKSAVLTGKNVLYVTCEVAAKIISERLDATMSDTEIKLLVDRMHDVASRIKAHMPRSGQLQIAEYPSGTLTPSMLRAKIESYKSPMLQPDGTVRPAIQFDMVVVDYADIMAPDHRTTDSIENSKSVYLALRAIASEENVAMLSATQTNREGHQATVAKASHVADDFNKVRTVDIMISINVTDEERAAGEARLYFAASRNQEGGFTIFIKQELAKMKFIASIVRIE
ncbi:DnaB-like helicase C-terminal domain-containing protein [Duganella sp. FT27W]|uniref:DnaB-like helicase C-terminal domain-containing protein n=1 Tax=Duganella sp. FT27W TaxID=2654636 RepID=UPI001D044E28|nr:DnaB-like helicase C-terminal domain-containing protein [Duganella sp. FT27W]